MARSTSRLSHCVLAALTLLLVTICPVAARAGAAPAAGDAFGYAWGLNNQGGLGTGSVARALTPTPIRLPPGTVDVQAGDDTTVARTVDGQVWTWGGNEHGQIGNGTTATVLAPTHVVMPTGSPVVGIAVGSAHVLAL